MQRLIKIVLIALTTAWLGATLRLHAAPPGNPQRDSDATEPHGNTEQSGIINIKNPPFNAVGDGVADDTLAIREALKACATAGGGKVYIPAGAYIVSRQGAESPILEIPSDTILYGDGSASILRFDPKVNDSNFWRMLGAGGQGCRNVVIRDLHLDGSNTFTSYEPGKTPEHNHGIFFHSKESSVENMTIRDCLVENFSGDCIALGMGCRNVTIRDVSLRNFVRQGIQMGGGNGARDYLVSGCQDLEGEVHPGGSTIHVEHARGLKNVIITNNRCRHSILAGGVDNIVIHDNVVAGRLVGNGNSNASVQGNIVRGGDEEGFVVQLGYASGLVLSNNLISGEHAEGGGIYVWGASRYNPSPSRDVVISNNLVQVRGRGIFLNGVHEGTVGNNSIKSEDPEQRVVLQRVEHIDSDQAGAALKASGG